MKNLTRHVLATRSSLLRRPSPKRPSLSGGLRPGSNDYKNMPSLQTNEFDTSAKTKHTYTDTLIKGIAVMHKSNLIPIVSNEMAIATAKMRRG